MSDLFDRVVGDRDLLQKLLSKIPGFSGYFERGNRRDADKLLRETLANRFDELWQRVSGLQRDLISKGEIESIDDLEAAALKLRQFIDRIRTAAYGYAGFFDAVKIDEAELNLAYQYDLALFQLHDEVSHAIDNVEASIGTDGLPAAIRNLVSLGQKCIDMFERRHEVMISGGNPSQ